MDWITINDEGILEEIKNRSFDKSQLIFKHSTRCSVSKVVKNRLNKEPLSQNIDFYFLDLLAFRKISNAIADSYEVRHESPQVLLIKDGKCIFNESHHAIFMDEILEKSS